MKAEYIAGHYVLVGTKAEMEEMAELLAKKRKAKGPTLDEVKAYQKETGYDFNPIEFFGHYDSLGWEKSKNKPLVKWKSAAANTWAKGKKIGVATTTKDTGKCFACPEVGSPITVNRQRNYICNECRALLKAAPNKLSFKDNVIPKYSLNEGELEIMIQNQKARR